MTIKDIVALITDEELTAIRKEAKELSETIPVNDRGDAIDWFQVLVEDWWKKEQEMPNGWFRWWEEM